MTAATSETTASSSGRNWPDLLNGLIRYCLGGSSSTGFSKSLETATDLGEGDASVAALARCGLWQKGCRARSFSTLLAAAENVLERIPMLFTALKPIAMIIAQSTGDGREDLTRVADELLNGWIMDLVGSLVAIVSCECVERSNCSISRATPRSVYDAIVRSAECDAHTDLMLSQGLRVMMRKHCSGTRERVGKIAAVYFVSMVAPKMGIEDVHDAVFYGQAPDDLFRVVTKTRRATEAQRMWAAAALVAIGQDINSAGDGGSAPTPMQLSLRTCGPMFSYFLNHVAMDEALQAALPPTKIDDIDSKTLNADIEQLVHDVERTRSDISNLLLQYGRVLGCFGDDQQSVANTKGSSGGASAAKTHAALAQRKSQASRHQIHREAAKV